MDFRRISLPIASLFTVLSGVVSLAAAPAFAGGNHHKKVVVQTTTFQTTQVQAASPVQFVQVTQAAAPVQFVQMQQAAAPVQFVQMQQAAAPVQFVQMQAASPVATPKAGAPAAASPTNPAKGMQAYVNGTLYNLVATSAASPGIGGSPTDADDGLSADERATILKTLAPFVTKYKNLNLRDSALRNAIRSKTIDLYATASGKDTDTAESGKVIDKIVDEALGNSPDSDSKTDSSTSSTSNTTQQMMMVPVTSAAPMQLFLIPTKVKHHSSFR